MAKKATRMLSLLFLLFIAICASACGQGEAASGSEASGMEERKPYDLSSEKWKGYEEISEDEGLWTATGYWEYLEPEMLDGTAYLRVCSATDGQNYYVLYSHMAYEDNVPTDNQYYLTCLNAYTLEVSTTQLQLGEGEGTSGEAASGLPELAAALDGCDAFVRGMDVLEGRLCLYVVWGKREGGGPRRSYAVYLDTGLKAERVVDLTPGLQEAGLLEGEAAPEGIRWGRDGNIYIGTFQVAVMDGEGKYLKTLECPGSTGSAVLCTGRLPDGELLFEATDSDSGDVVIFCLRDGKERVLHKGQNIGAELRYIDNYGRVFSLLGGHVLLWDAARGGCRRLYKDTSLMVFTYDAVIEDPDGGMILVYYDWEGFYWSRLEPEAEGEETVVSVQATWGLSQNLEEAAAEYSRKHPGTRIEMILPEDGEKGEITMNKLMAQISVGEGPDILVLHQDEMLVLQDKGALADLTELLAGELLDQVFSGVIRQGSTDDGRLWAVIPEAVANTLVVSEELWPEDSWTYKDVMRLIEEREEAGEPAVWLTGQNMDSGMLLYYLVIRDVEGGSSDLVDREKKKCYFDTEEFVGLLEFCRKHGRPLQPYEDVSLEEHAAQLRDGSALAYSLYGSLKGFSHAMTAFGDGYKCIGYPTDHGSGSYISCSYCLAVTATTDKYEVACDFLQYLMSDRVQRRIMNTSSVRRDIFTTYVVENPGSSEEPKFLSIKGGYTPLTGRPDGSSFLPEYMEIMEGGEPDPWAYKYIRRIISEEAGAYFAGDKSAEEAAEIIQRRVWLYLNE
ncbi:MAG: extracellular solute-binding protein [Lachnospiraceae bacterium]|nr:extracellular solute-binding protein [Lachnospiraceae bacterium]